MGCIYEVKIEADLEIAPQYGDWLKKHLAEVISAGGFLKGEIYEVESPPKGYKCWVCHYHALNREQIEAYLEIHAPRLREDGVRRFGNRFRAERRILNFQMQG